VLDLRKALSAPAPPRDPLEPNDDVALVRDAPFLATAAKPSVSLQARVDQNKDPADVYRALIPAHGRLAVTVTATSGDVALRVWGPRTPTILERGNIEKRDLLAVRQLKRRDTVMVPNHDASAKLVYVDVSAGVSRTASYSLRLATTS
jgi:hypothetical protein